MQFHANPFPQCFATLVDSTRKEEKKVEFKPIIIIISLVPIIRIFQMNELSILYIFQRFLVKSVQAHSLFKCWKWCHKQMLCLAWLSVFIFFISRRHFDIKDHSNYTFPRSVRERLLDFITLYLKYLMHIPRNPSIRWKCQHFKHTSSSIMNKMSDAVSVLIDVMNKFVIMNSMHQFIVIDWVQSLLFTINKQSLSKIFTHNTKYLHAIF